MNIEIKLNDIIEFSKTRTGKNSLYEAFRITSGNDVYLGIEGFPFKSLQGTLIIESYLSENMKQFGIEWGSIIDDMSFDKESGIILLSAKKYHLK